MRLLLPLLAFALASGPAHAAADARACSLAAQIVSRQLAEPLGDAVVYSPEPGSTFRNLAVKDLLARPRPVEPPSPALAQAFVADRARNAVAECADVRAVLTARGVAFDGAALEAARKTHALGPNLNLPQTYIRAIMLPVLSGDGREALVETWSICRGLCGAGFIRLFRREPNGPWDEGAPIGPMWMS